MKPPVIEVSGERSNTVIPRNMDKITNYVLSVTYPYGYADFWDFMVTFNGGYSTFTGIIEGTEIDLNNTNWDFRIQNNFKLPWGFQFELTYNQRSRWIWQGSIEVEGNSNLRFGLRKDFSRSNFNYELLEMTYCTRVPKTFNTETMGDL
jgi:hypothetical protein